MWARLPRSTTNAVHTLQATEAGISRLVGNGSCRQALWKLVSIYSDARIRLQKKPNVLQFRWIKSLPFLGSDWKHKANQLCNFNFLVQKVSSDPNPSKSLQSVMSTFKCFSIHAQGWWVSSCTISSPSALLPFSQGQSNNSSISSSTQLSPLLLRLCNEQLARPQNTGYLFAFRPWDSGQLSDRIVASHIRGLGFEHDSCKNKYTKNLQ